MHNISYLQDILILLIFSVGIVITFKQLNLSPVLGYLLSGTLIGPYGLNLLDNKHLAESIAELGIVFLLFAIGLELTFERLKSMKKYVLGFGSLQMIITSFLIGSICYYFLDLSIELSLIIGSALAFSSTAIVLQTINEKAEQTTQAGRLSLSVLLLQDLAVIPILVLIPLISDSEITLSKAIGNAIINAIIALTIIFAIGILLLRPIFRLVVSLRSDVLFLSFTLIIILGSAFISDKLGLSLALGAFVAGLMVAETEYKHRVENEILSLKSLLLGLFFMTIGMSFQIDLLLKNLGLILLATVSLILIKSLVIIILCKLFKIDFAVAVHSGLLLSQGGEFAFIVFLMALGEKIMPSDLSQLLITIVTTTMAVTPILDSVGRKIKNYLYTKNILNNKLIKTELNDLSGHIVIIGFGKTGKIVSAILKKRGINHLIIDNNYRKVKVEKRNGNNIYYGDAKDKTILNHISLHKSKLSIVTAGSELNCMRITRFISDKFPSTTLVVQSESMNHAEKFKKIGANLIVAKNLESSLQLARKTLITIGVDNDDIYKLLEDFNDMNSENITNIRKRDEKFP